MEFNKLVSLVLGFIVLILVFVWISNRVRSSQTTSKTSSVTITVTPSVEPTQGEDQGSTWNPLSFLFDRQTETPTPTQKAGNVAVVSGTPKTSTTPAVKMKIVEGNTTPVTKGPITYTNSSNGDVQQIPETGVATILIPLSLAAMSAGIYLKRKS